MCGSNNFFAAAVTSSNHWQKNVHHLVPTEEYMFRSKHLTRGYITLMPNFKKLAQKTNHFGMRFLLYSFKYIDYSMAGTHLFQSMIIMAFVIFSEPLLLGADRTWRGLQCRTIHGLEKFVYVFAGTHVLMAPKFMTSLHLRDFMDHG